MSRFPAPSYKATTRLIRVKSGKGLKNNGNKEVEAQDAATQGDLHNAACASGRGQLGKTKFQFSGEKLNSTVVFMTLRWAPISQSSYKDQLRRLTFERDECRVGVYEV